MDEKQLNQTDTKVAKLICGIHTHCANVDRKKWNGSYFLVSLCAGLYASVQCVWAVQE